jgi:hypothetical protein
MEQPELIIKPGFLPIKKVTEIYGLSRAYIYQLRYARKLFHYELGSRTFIDVVELENLIKSGKKTQ